MEKLLERLELFANLPHGWDGHNAFAPRKGALENVREVLRILNNCLPIAVRYLVDDDLTPTPAGTITIVWTKRNAKRRPCREVSVQVSDKAISWYERDVNGVAKFHKPGYFSAIATDSWLSMQRLRDTLKSFFEDVACHDNKLLYDRIVAIAELPHGWDGYGAYTPQPVTIEAVTNVLGLLKERLPASVNYLCPDDLTPTPAGTVTIVWTKRNTWRRLRRELCVEVNSEAIGWYSQDDEGNADLDEDAYLLTDKTFIDKLVLALQDFLNDVNESNNEREK